jgi:hypothetical protein
MPQNSFRRESTQEKSFHTTHFYKRKLVQSEHSNKSTDSH